MTRVPVPFEMLAAGKYEISDWEKESIPC
jgi:hypothetical protein